MSSGCSSSACRCWPWSRTGSCLPRDDAHPPAPDTRQELIRKFHLTWQDTLEVEAAVREGRATRPDLQPAARDFAEHTLTPPTFRGRPLTTYPVAARWAWLVFAIAAVAFIAYAAALGSGISLSYLIIYGTGIAFSIAARRRRRRAAAASLTANSPRPTPDDDHPNDRANREPRRAPDDGSGDRSY